MTVTLLYMWSDAYYIPLVELQVILAEAAFDLKSWSEVHIFVDALNFQNMDAHGEIHSLRRNYVEYVWYALMIM